MTEPMKPEGAPQDDRTEVKLRYGAASRVTDEEGRERVALVGNGDRDDVRLAGRVREPLVFREALSALYEVVGSDFRYVPKDRTAYLAFQQMRRKTSVVGQWQAQLEYFAWLERNDPLAWCILDPIVSVCPDEVAFEVFSKDESSYARLAVDLKAFELDGDPVCGTTNIDFSQALFDGLQHLRTYRETRISIGVEDQGKGGASVTVATEEAPTVLEKSIRLPDSWIRGFLQVQSAPTLPCTRVKLAPIDLYNLLRHLRLHADQKRKGRGLRVELVPGEAPRLVLEPWETVLETTAGPYAGRTAEVIRLWGRRRLMLLRRLLPFVESVEIHLLGSGLPSFWVLRAGMVTLTLGLTGFTSANWSQAVSFDLLLPRRRAEEEGKGDVHASVFKHLASEQAATSQEIAKALRHDHSAVLEALQTGSQEGRLTYDVARGVYRHRPLLAEPLPLDRLAYRNGRERQAYDLLARSGAVRVETENQIHGSGLELTGKVLVESDQREYRPQILIDPEGRLRRAECTCKQYRQHKLKEGPCSHMVALRILHQQEVRQRLLARGGQRAAVTVETRTYVKRHARGEDVYMVSLDQKRLRVQWGLRGERLRAQNLVFNSVNDARSGYFERVDQLENQGFLDASAGS